MGEGKGGQPLFPSRRGCARRAYLQQGGAGDTQSLFGLAVPGGPSAFQVAASPASSSPSFTCARQPFRLAEETRRRPRGSKRLETVQLPRKGNKQEGGLEGASVLRPGEGGSPCATRPTALVTAAEVLRALRRVKGAELAASRRRVLRARRASASDPIHEL
jgi:hypothetical protein